MGVIKQLKTFITGRQIFPITKTRAVFNDDGERLDEILQRACIVGDIIEGTSDVPRDADTLGGTYSANDFKKFIEESVSDVKYDKSTSTVNVYKNGQYSNSFKVESGACTLLTMSTNETTWVGSKDTTISVTHQNEKFENLHFDEEGKCVVKLHFIGKYTISVVNTSDTITNIFSNTAVGNTSNIYISKGLDPKSWLRSIGKSTEGYDTIEDITADEALVRELMTRHASCDYFINCLMNSTQKVLDIITTNSVIMKWLGLRDYVCDKAMAIEGVTEALLASEYWEYILKDHVPVMTSDTAPYGEASANSSYPAPQYYPYQAFDGKSDGANIWLPDVNFKNAYLQYRFTNPICVKKVFINHRLGGTATLGKIKILGSNDNTNWNELTEEIDVVLNGQWIDLRGNDNYYLYYRYQYYGTMTPSGTNNIALFTLQFYGRSLNVSVPTMTSNTAPYGEVFADSEYADLFKAYKAFNGTNTKYSDVWCGANIPGYIGYDFGKKVKIKFMTIRNRNGSGDSITNISAPKTFKVQGSNDNSNWVDIANLSNSNFASNALTNYHFENDNEFRYYRLYVESKNVDYAGYSYQCIIGQLQFYGVDYSEREFAEGSTMKYIYDHGLELIPLEEPSVIGGATGLKREDDLYGKVIKGTTKNWYAIFAENAIDFSQYKYMKINVSDEMYCGPSYSAFNVKIISTKSYDYDTISLAEIGCPYIIYNLLLYLDISSINSTAYTAFCDATTGDNRWGSINEWWLE